MKKLVLIIAAVVFGIPSIQAETTNSMVDATNYNYGNSFIFVEDGVRDLFRDTFGTTLGSILDHLGVIGSHFCDYWGVQNVCVCVFGSIPDPPGNI